MKNIFISYNHDDERWKDQVVSHFSVFEPERLIKILDDRKTEPGADWHQEIENYLNEANAAILLISKNFLNSKYIRDTEIPTILKKKKDKGLHVIPLIIMPCAWEKVNWLKRMELRPKDAIPLSTLKTSEIDVVLARFVSEVELLLNGSSPNGKHPINTDLTGLTLKDEKHKDYLTPSIDLVGHITKTIKNVDLKDVIIAVIHSNRFTSKKLTEVLQFLNESEVKWECPSLNVEPFGYSDAIKSAINNATHVLYISLKSEECDSGWRKFAGSVAEDARKETIYYTY